MVFREVFLYTNSEMVFRDVFLYTNSEMVLWEVFLNTTSEMVFRERFSCIPVLGWSLKTGLPVYPILGWSLQTRFYVRRESKKNVNIYNTRTDRWTKQDLPKSVAMVTDTLWEEETRHPERLWLAVLYPVINKCTSEHQVLDPTPQGLQRRVRSISPHWWYLAKLECILQSTCVVFNTP